MLSGDIPESILLINTAEWQGQVRREVYFNSLLGAIPRMINVGVFSTQKQVKRFPSVVCRFLNLRWSPLRLILHSAVLRYDFNINLFV